MKKLFHTFLARPVTAGMFFFSIVILGIVSVYNLPVELSPHVNYPRLSLRALWQGNSPESVEANLTSILEAELSTLKGLKRISSDTREGNCSIDLEFFENTDMDFAKIDINEKIRQIKKNLPKRVYISVSDYIPDDFKDLQGFITYSISSTESANKILKYAKENIIYPLKGIEGVSNVKVSGGTERELKVILDYNKVVLYGITNAEIAQAISNIEKIFSAGVIRKNNYEYFLKVNNIVVNIDDIANQPVKLTSNGSAILLRNIADVYDGFEKANYFFRINGRETVTLEITKEIGANTIEVAENVHRKIDELVKAFPEGYSIKLEIDKSKNMREDLGELFKSAFFSLMIIVVVLLLIFNSFRYSFVIVLSIIFSLLFAFILFYLFEISLNILTISAFILGFGFMVDNSIVVIDFIDHHYNGGGIKKLSVILKNIFPPVLASTLTTLGVFIPLLFLTGELRLYFEQFALGIIFNLFASMMIAFMIVPLVYLKLGLKRKSKAKVKDSKLFKIYSSIITFLFKRKKIALVIFILLVGLPVWLLPARIETPVIGTVYNSIFDSEFYAEIKPYVNNYLGGALNLFFNKISRGEMWQFGETTYLAVRLELPNGNDISRINELTKDFEKEVLRYRGDFENIIAKVYSPENSYLKITFTPKQSYSSFPYQLKNYLIAYATQLGGLTVSVYGYGQGFYNGGGAGSISNFTLTVKGFNYKKVKDLALRVKKRLERNPRVANVDINKGNWWGSDKVYEVVGKIKREALTSKKVTLQELLAFVRKNSAGNVAGYKFKLNNDEVFCKVKFENYDKLQLKDLNNIIFTTSGGEKAKLKEFIDFTVQRVMPSIKREDQQYIRYVKFEFKGPYKYGNKFVKKVIEKTQIPEGYKLEKRGFYFFNQDEESNVWMILLFAVIIIFMVTSSLFESIKKPMLILVAIPFAIIGTIYVFYFAEMNLDRGAYAGILLLIGLSVNNSIILIDYLSNRLHKPSIENLIKLSYSRVRPIFTTTLTTIAALLPLLISAKSTFWKSLSWSITGGITLSAVCVIIAIPLFYGIIISKHK